MNDANRHNDHLTAEDLRKYRDRELSAAEQHRVERLLLENPLYADALEGLEAAGHKTVELNRVSGELRERLQNRIGDKKVRRSPVWIPAAAASVVLVLSIGLYLRLQEKPESDTMVSSPAPQISASKEAAPAVENTVPRPSASRPEMVAQPKRPLLARKPAPIPAKDSLILPKDYLAASSAKPGSASRAYSSPTEEIVVSSTGIPLSQEVHGQVTDSTNQPLAGVWIRVKNTSRGSSTDSLGRFRLENLQKNDSLQVSFIGFEPKTVRVGDLRADAIQLKPDMKALAEVVVTGYGAKKAMPSSAVRIDYTKTVLPAAPANYKTYLDENRRMPPAAKEKGISGTVRIRFQVAADGSVSQFSVVKSLGYGCDEEALRLIREGPRWQPAFRNGQPFAQFVEQDIVF